MPYASIAKSLLEINCETGSFHVDFFDIEVGDRIKEELESLGAKVERVMHKTTLHVICPEQGE